MPKIYRINQADININGTALVGKVNATFEQLVKKFGPPTESFDGYKTDSEWHIEFENNEVATIYNWKDGVNYCGESGLPVDRITEWHIGGHDSRVKLWIYDYIHNSWPIFDEIRQLAQN
jgi:hypothetical protein